jgi:hypothetical protein
LEAPGEDSKCCSCGKEMVVIYRCKECFHGSLYCLQCCLTDHERHPFHRIEQWTGSFYESTSLMKLGFILHLGHGGQRCPGSAWEDVAMMEDNDTAKLEEDSSKEDHLTIVEANGVHEHVVQWCSCAIHERTPKHIQILRTGLFPASHKIIKTAFTFNVLQQFHIDSVECNTSASSFFTKLRRFTNKAFPSKVQVSFLNIGIQIFFLQLHGRTGTGNS